MIQQMINNKQKKIKQSGESVYFKNSRHILKKYPFLQDYYFAKNRFDIIKANIIIKALENKMLIEETHQKLINSDLSSKELESKLREFVLTLPQFEIIHQKIIVPFFNRANNLIYYYNILKLGEYPYTRLSEDFQSLMIDPFDNYGLPLFTSPFTTLMPIASDSTTTCYYHIDYQTLFFINDQGSLDFEVSLFDKYLKHQDDDNIVERLNRVASAFFAGNRYDFIDSLHSNGFMSTKLKTKIYKRLAQHYKKRNLILTRGISDVEI